MRAHNPRRFRMAEDRVTVAREDQGRSWGPVYEGPGELVTGRDCAHNKGKTTKGFKQRTRDKTYIYIYVKKKILGYRMEKGLKRAKVMLGTRHRSAVPFHSDS